MNGGIDAEVRRADRRSSFFNEDPTRESDWKAWCWGVKVDVDVDMGACIDRFAQFSRGSA